MKATAAAAADDDNNVDDDDCPFAWLEATALFLFLGIAVTALFSFVNITGVGREGGATEVGNPVRSTLARCACM